MRLTRLLQFPDYSVSEAWSEVSAVSREFFNMVLLKYLCPLHDLPAPAAVQEEMVVPTAESKKKQRGKYQHWPLITEEMAASNNRRNSPLINSPLWWPLITEEIRVVSMI